MLRHSRFVHLLQRLTCRSRDAVMVNMNLFTQLSTADFRSVMKRMLLMNSKGCGKQ